MHGSPLYPPNFSNFPYVNSNAPKGGRINLGCPATEVHVENGAVTGVTADGTLFFTMTGFHGAHVFAGVVMISVALYRGTAGQFSARHHDAVEATSLY